MEPFALLRQAFHREAMGDLAGARARFRDALDGFAALVGNADFRATLTTRARALPLLDVDPAATADHVLARLPRWLLEVHTTRCADALRAGRLDLARHHWAVLIGARTLAARAGGYDDAVWRHELLDSYIDAKDLEASEAERGRALERLERLLRVDSDHRTARRLASDGYALELRLCLQLDRQKTLRLPKLRRVRLRGRMARASRRLQLHLRVLLRDPRADRKGVARDFALLSIYHHAGGTPSLALPLARRACRLDPGDRELRTLLGSLRKVAR